MATPDGKGAGGREIEIPQTGDGPQALSTARAPTGILGRIAQGIRFAISGNQPGTTEGEWFGPGRPMAPVAPEESKGRQLDYPFAVNVPFTPRGEQGENALDFPTLRRLADPVLGGFDLLRLAVETRKDQMSGLEWGIRERDERSDGGKRARVIESALRRPDGVNTFRQWQRLLLEDLLVIDAPAVYVNRIKGKPSLPPMEAPKPKRLPGQPPLPAQANGAAPPPGKPGQPGQPPRGSVASASEGEEQPREGDAEAQEAAPAEGQQQQGAREGASPPAEEGQGGAYRAPPGDERQRRTKLTKGWEPAPQGAPRRRPGEEGDGDVANATARGRGEAEQPPQDGGEQPQDGGDEGQEGQDAERGAAPGARADGQDQGAQGQQQGAPQGNGYARDGKPGAPPVPPAQGEQAAQAGPPGAPGANGALTPEVQEPPRLETAEDVGVLLEVVDGATLKRLVREDGRTPLPPDAAYLQVLKGLPAVHYAADELVYSPRNQRPHRIYGYSPVEQVITTVNIALRRQLSQLEYYTAGNVPDLLLGVPETWTPDQIAAFQTWWDTLLTGNTAARRGARFVPGGTQPFPLRDPKIKDEWDDWLARLICFAFSLPYQSLVKEVNRATAETSAEMAQEEGLEPLKLWFKDLMDQVLALAFDSPMLEFVWLDEEIADAKTKADVMVALVGAKIFTPNEAREAYGKDPTDDGDAMQEPPPPTFPGGAPGAEGDGLGSRGGRPPPQFGDKEKKPNPFAPDDEAVEQRAVKLAAALVSALDRGRLGKASRSLDPVPRVDGSKATERLTARLARYLRACAVATRDALLAPASKAAGGRTVTKEDLQRAIDALPADEADDVREALGISLGGVADDAAVSALNHLAAAVTETTFNYGTALEQVHEAARLWAVDYAAILVTNIGQTTRDAIADFVEEAIDDGSSVDMLAEELVDSLWFSEARARTIARTELAFANVHGNLMTWEAVGVVQGKEWVVAQDEVCDDCLLMDGDVVALDEPFIMPDGTSVDGPPGHPNCRCDVLPVLDLAAAEDDPDSERIAAVAKYSPDQPRDEAGRFAESSASRSTVGSRGAGKPRGKVGEPPAFRDIDEAKAWAKKHLGITFAVSTGDRRSRFGRLTYVNPERVFNVIGYLARAHDGGAPMPDYMEFQPTGDAFIASVGPANIDGKYRGAGMIVSTDTLWWVSPEAEMRRTHASGWMSGRDPAHPILHELGHLAHATRLREMGKLTEHDFRRLEFGSELPANRMGRAHALSKYATVSSAEFVAEAYARVAEGRSLTKDQLALYEELDGPPLPRHKLTKYDPSQPRDDDGRFAEVGGGRGVGWEGATWDERASNAGQRLKEQFGVELRVSPVLANRAEIEHRASQSSEVSRFERQVIAALAGVAEVLSAAKAGGLKLPKAVALDYDSTDRMIASSTPDLKGWTIHINTANPEGYDPDYIRGMRDSGFWATDHRHGTMIHELGHVNTADKIGTDFNQQAPPSAWKVSRYAGVSAHEFAAEAFAAAATGRIVDPDVRGDYRRLTGEDLPRVLWPTGSARVEKYDEDQPRDERGRWTEGGGSGGSPDVGDWADNPFTDEQKARHVAKVEDAVRDACVKIDREHMLDKVRVVWGTPEERAFSLEGNTHYASAVAGFDGIITVYAAAFGDPNDIGHNSNPFLVSDLVRTLAHEFQHLEFRSVRATADLEMSTLTALMRAPEFDDGPRNKLMRASGEPTKLGRELFPVYAALWDAGYYDTGALRKEDGVTEYSKSWWDTWEGVHGTEAGAHVTLIDNCLNETFSEMDAIGWGRTAVRGGSDPKQRPHMYACREVFRQITEGKIKRNMEAESLLEVTQMGRAEREAADTSVRGRVARWRLAEIARMRWEEARG